jgi:hypothetical protein
VWASDLRLASEEMLDGVVNELVLNDTPPMPIAWASLEELTQEVWINQSIDRFIH